MPPSISIVIPNRNGSATLDECLRAAFASCYSPFEVVVVDDCSTDDSTAIARCFPCTLVALDKHVGAAAARNIGAQHSKGEIIFFTDADCLLQKDALAIAEQTLAAKGPRHIIGGTYTARPWDPGFFSTFQSAFIHYSETKGHDRPDYIATHALAMSADAFRRSGGFSESFLPIIEDVELSHRLRRQGFTLYLNPAILVQHIFNFDWRQSLRNAIRKARYWTIYSIANRDLLADSGTASVELKASAAAWLLTCLLAGVSFFRQELLPMLLAVSVQGANLFFSRRLALVFFRTGGLFFGCSACLYYSLIYPAAVGIGAARGAFFYRRSISQWKRS